MGRSEIEDGFGCSGLVPSKRELEEQRYVDSLQAQLREARAGCERYAEGNRQMAGKLQAAKEMWLECIKINNRLREAINQAIDALSKLDFAEETRTGQALKALEAALNPEAE